jgi:hypothetical protein
MLRIYPVVLETLTALRGLITQIERRDSDLSRQLRRAAASIALNLGEGMYSRGKNPRVAITPRSVLLVRRSRVSRWRKCSDMSARSMRLSSPSSTG